LYWVRIVPSNDVEGTIAPVSVTAPSPIAAAEAVYKGKLVTVGKPSQLRARVWHLSEDYSAGLLEFYEPEKGEAKSKSIERSEEVRIAILVGLVCLGTGAVAASIINMAG
jgi:hypothetical protein